VRKTLFYVAYAASPFAVASAFLIPYLGAPPNGGLGLAASAMGLAAYTLFCNQLILASRPRPIIDALGLKGLLRLHFLMGIAAWVLVLIHHLIKESLGFGEDTAQSFLGSAAWTCFAIVMVLALVLFANTFLAKLAPVVWARKVFKGIGFDYRRNVLIHDLTLVLALAVGMHILLAGTSDASINLPGMAVVVLYYLVAFVFWIRYKLRSRIKSTAP
jgi:hypothetical protein